MVTLVNPVQPLNAAEPIDVTLDGMLTLINPVQPLNAEEPIEVTLDGMETLNNPVQSQKALAAICVVPSFIFIEVSAGIIPLYLYATLFIYTIPSGILSK